MNDMRATIIAKSDQLNSDDLIGGRALTITVTRGRDHHGRAAGFDLLRWRRWETLQNQENLCGAFWSTSGVLTQTPTSDDP